MMSGGGYNDPRFTPGSRASTGVLGVYPVPLGSRLRVVECVHCNRPLGLASWDYWNGFLVVCPHCGGNHGKPWGLERTVLAGFLLNVFSFPFVLRPRRAFSAILGFALVDWVLLSRSARDDMNSALLFASIGILMLGPVLVNAIVLVRHQMMLDEAPPGDPGSRGV